MKKIAFLSLIFLFSVSVSSYAQTPITVKKDNKETSVAQKKSDLAEILKLKRNYISENLSLSDEVAKKFWPIYDRYTIEEQKCHKSFKSALESKDITRDKIKDDSKLSDEQLDFYLMQKMQYKERMFNIDKRFFTDAKMVLSPRELKKFYQLEQSFKKQCSQKMHANSSKQSEKASPVKSQHKK